MMTTPPAPLNDPAPPAVVSKFRRGMIRQWISGLAALWRHRRDAELLASLDDHMLADIGLTRSDLHQAMAEPRWRDPTVLLIDRRRERRQSRRATLGVTGAVTDAMVFRIRAGTVDARAEAALLTW
jgi:uncharacterized protein YjiS (DUF1127 family)